MYKFEIIEVIINLKSYTCRFKIKFVQSLTKYAITVTHYSVFVGRNRVLRHQNFVWLK